MSAVPVYVVDDQLAFRVATAALLRSCDDFVLSGEASDAPSALADLASGAAPGRAIVLMDINMPGMNGFDATRRLRRQRPDLIVLLMSTYDDSEMQAQTAACGAVGYLHKEDLSPEVLSGVWALHG